MAQSTKEKAVGNALLAYLTTQLSGQGYASIDWTPGMHNAPQYPCNAATDLPRIQLNFVSGRHAPGRTKTGGSISEFWYTYKLWVQALQTPGQDHQELMLDKLSTIVSKFLGNWDPTAMAGTGYTIDTVAGPNGSGTIDTLLDNQIEHPLADPARRVSQGQITMTICGQIVSV